MNLKIGDTVFAYLVSVPGGLRPHGLRVSGKVQEIDNDCILICGTWFHVKQCRRLKKVKK